jgi:hypothetical protein
MKTMLFVAWVALLLNISKNCQQESHQPVKVD